jgi:hypothetical protein
LFGWLLAIIAAHVGDHRCTFHNVTSIMAASSIPEPRDTRLRWHPFTKTTLLKGEAVVSFPFLEDTNFKDLFFVRHVLAERPYKAGYGATIKAWDEIAVGLKDMKHPETGELLYGIKGIKGKALRDRFLACMEFVKSQERDALRRTGTDDEPEPCELLNALEDLLEDWQSHCSLGESKTLSVAAQKKKDRDAAEAVRQASLGNLTGIHAAAPDEVSDVEADVGGVLIETPASNRRLSYACRGTSTSSSAATSTRSRSPMLGAHHSDVMQDMMKRSQERDVARERSKRARIDAQLDLDKKREDRDNRRMQMEEQRLKIEAERLEFDRVQREESRVERTAAVNLMNALANSLMNQNNNKN